MKWSSDTLGNLCNMITDGKHGDCINEEGSGYFFISAKDVNNGRVNYENARQITESDFQETHRRTDLQPGDILLTNSGTIGRLAIASDDDKTVRTTLQKSVAVLKPKKDIILSSYLYYSLSSVTNQLVSTAGGAAQKNLLLGDLRRFSIETPSLSIQREIASILSTYDDLIENNRRRMALLEDAARQVYQEWFVRLRFPGHEHTRTVDGVPEGWERVPLESALVLQRGFDLPGQDRADGSIPIYASTGVNGYHNVAKVQAPGIVTGRSGSLGKVHYVHEDFWPLNTTLWVKEFRQISPLFAYFLLSSLNLEQYNGSVSVPTLDRKVVHRIEVVVPKAKVQALFGEYVMPMLTQVRQLGLYNDKLRAARDLLLPKLMSGEIAAISG